jgi:hypothetical protein
LETKSSPTFFSRTLERNISQLWFVGARKGDRKEEEAKKRRKRGKTTATWQNGGGKCAAAVAQLWCSSS